MFHCSSDLKCITTSDLCNNITDCLLGEDEHNMICEQFCQWPSLNTCTSKSLFMKMNNNIFLIEYFCFLELGKYANLCSNTEFYCDGKCVSIIHRCDNKPYCCTLVLVSFLEIFIEKFL